MILSLSLQRNTPLSLLRHTSGLVFLYTRHYFPLNLCQAVEFEDTDVYLMVWCCNLLMQNITRKYSCLGSHPHPLL